MRREISAKLCRCGPVTTAVPTAAGSSRLCPPMACRLPPTKATSAQAKNAISSPRVSITNTASSARGQLSRRREPVFQPASTHSVWTRAKRSGWRGAHSSSRSGQRVRRRRCRATTSVSSPSWVLAATHTGRGAPRAEANAARKPSSPSGTATSYLRLPSTWTWSARAPSFWKRRASAADCAATHATVRNARPIRGRSSR